MIEIANCAYVILEDTTAKGLMVKVNAMIAGGWFLIGGVGFGPDGYAQAMGFRGTPPPINFIG